MTVRRRLGCVEIWFAVAVFALGTAVSNRVAGQETDKSPPGKLADRDNPNNPNYRLPGNEHKGGAERDKLLGTIKETLNALTPKPPHSKKADEDLFVVGTIDLQNHHAAVDYLIKEGVQQTAEFIADFVLGKTGGAIREWRAFDRVKTMKAAEVLLAKTKSESIEGRLAAFKMSTGGKKSPDDYFVVGTADMNSATMNADIRFEILNGVKAAADFLIDFIFNRPKSHKGEWHVFFRGHTEAQAVEYRQQMRDWYDSLEAERARLAAIYHAKTTRRC
jgi:hypothetical protein